MTGVTFPVISRFTGTSVNSQGRTLEPLVVERELGSSTKDKVIAHAAKYGWVVEDGYGSALQLCFSGELVLHSADQRHTIHVEFGARGQITYCRINKTRVHKHRFLAVVAELIAGKPGAVPEPVVVDIPVAPKPEVLAYREIASLRENQHLTLWTLAGSIEVIVTSNHAGDDADYGLAYALSFERHTRARVTITAADLLHKQYTISPRWHDDQEV